MSYSVIDGLVVEVTLNYFLYHQNYTVSLLLNWILWHDFAAVMVCLYLSIYLLTSKHQQGRI